MAVAKRNIFSIVHGTRTWNARSSAPADQPLSHSALIPAALPSYLWSLHGLSKVHPRVGNGPALSRVSYSRWNRYRTDLAIILAVWNSDWPISAIARQVWKVPFLSIPRITYGEFIGKMCNRIWEERFDSRFEKKKNHGLFLAYFGFVTDQDSRIIYFINHRECFFFSKYRTWQLTNLRVCTRFYIFCFLVLFFFLPSPLAVTTTRKTEELCFRRDRESRYESEPKRWYFNGKN